MTPAEGLKKGLNDTRKEVSKVKSVVLISPFVPSPVQGVVPKIKLEPLHHRVIIPDEGVIDPATGKRMSQKDVDELLALPCYKGKSYAEVRTLREGMMAATETCSKGKKVVVSSHTRGDKVEIEPLALINWVVQSWERAGVSLPMEKTQQIILEMATSLDKLLHGQPVMKMEQLVEDVTPPAPVVGDLISWVDPPVDPWVRETQWEISTLDPIVMWNPGQVAVPETIPKTNEGVAVPEMQMIPGGEDTEDPELGKWVV